jgi:uncharacterized membrane protein YidH (DUF202 family)
MPTEGQPAPPPVANERTALGWQRSSLSLAVIAALLLGHAVHSGEPLGAVGAVLVGCGAASVAAVGRRLYRARRRQTQGPAVRPLLWLMAVTVLAAAVAVGEVVGGA